MGDATPLSEDERRELEELRAQRRAREEAERARAEREELERLRAEEAMAAAKRDAPLEVQRAEQSAVATAKRSPSQADPRADRPNVTTAANKQPVSQEDLRAQAARERGKKLMEPGDDLSMPLGQKLVLLVVFLAVVGFAIAIAFSRT
jgi:cobalamin biosynthesis Mg chelatase CobN